MLQRPRVIAKVALVVLLILTSSVLSGCVAYSQDEDKSLRRSFGESVEIDYSFDLLWVWSWGPYKFRITPQNIEHVSIGGQEKDIIKVDIEVLSTNDKEAQADYANCVVPIDLLTEDLKSVDYSAWWIDTNGTEYPDPRDGKLDVGTVYTFYIPLEKPVKDSGLYYLTISDRDGYYHRPGETYWYLIGE
jgi:hypothetical protein